MYLLHPRVLHLCSLGLTSYPSQSNRVKSLYRVEGQAGGGGMLCPEWKPTETLIMHIFIGTCGTQTNLSPCKRVNERSAPMTGCEPAKLLCVYPDPTDLQALGSRVSPSLTYTSLSTEQGGMPVLLSKAFVVTWVSSMVPAHRELWEAWETQKSAYFF